jgi:hypothetical protein
MITGQPFDARRGLAAVGGRQGEGRQAEGGGQGQRRRGRAPCWPTPGPRSWRSSPAYERVIAWAEGELPKAPSGRSGAVSLPNGAGLVRRGAEAQHHHDLTPSRCTSWASPRSSASRPSRTRWPGRRASRTARPTTPNAPGSSRRAVDRRAARRLPAPLQRHRSPTTAASCRRSSATCRSTRPRWSASRRSARWPAAPPTPQGPQPRRRAAGPGLHPHAGRHRRPGQHHRPDVPRGHPRPRDAGRHPGAPEGQSEVPPGLPLRGLRRGLGALRRGAVQGDGRLQDVASTSSAWTPSCSAPRAWSPTPASTPRVGPRTRRSTT